MQMICSEISEKLFVVKGEHLLTKYKKQDNLLLFGNKK